MPFLVAGRALRHTLQEANGRFSLLLGLCIEAQLAGGLERIGSIRRWSTGAFLAEGLLLLLSKLGHRGEGIGQFLVVHVVGHVGRQGLEEVIHHWPYHLLQEVLHLHSRPLHQRLHSPQRPRR